MPRLPVTFGASSPSSKKSPTPSSSQTHKDIPLGTPGKADMLSSVVIPALILGGANAWRLWNEHWTHWEHDLHEHPIEERPEYQYQNIRTKNFPWGDGDKTLFWNDKVNFHKKDE
ncbi:MAG: Cytochrome c oxidase subunit 6A, mitochondrial [Bathelium mastoideum]|nr:MAG: Cytochrome c oxidase subunit 6A, mitochondrial [Bathelium mastoideum]KAI9689183.1 MAG: Cytochrome c oxidase subunit 6A, mitochondrial [Bathelium mastoideum]